MECFTASFTCFTKVILNLVISIDAYLGRSNCDEILFHMMKESYKNKNMIVLKMTKYCRKLFSESPINFIGIMI